MPTIDSDHANQSADECETDASVDNLEEEDRESQEYYYRHVAFYAVHGHERAYVRSRHLPENVLDWLSRGTGLMDEGVLAMLTALRDLRLREVEEAIDALRDRRGEPDAKAWALALLSRRLTRSS